MEYRTIADTALFRGINEQEMAAMLACLQARERSYARGAYIYREGETISAAGLVLSGEVHVEQTDVWGNTNLLADVGPGGLFAEAYACLPDTPSMVNVVAVQRSAILFLDTARLLTSCSSACLFHERLIRNLLAVLAGKNLELTRKISHTAPRSIRERVMAYLSFESVSRGQYQFVIPFSRQQLADYLRVDRSALSNELSKMRREGLIDYRKNWFSLRVVQGGK